MGNIAAIHSGKGAPRKLSQIEIQDLALSHIGPGNILANDSGFWMWRDSGVWEQVSDTEVKASVKSVMPDHEVTASKIGAVAKLIEMEQYGDYEMGQPFDGINCLNGELIFNGLGWVLQPHQKERHQISQAPVEYDPSADAPRFVRFLAEIFAGDDDAADKTQLVLELMGYTLLSTCRYEAFAILIGSGSNGKSVLLDVIKSLCGVRNTAAVQPEHMSSAFQRAYLHGKLANLVTEIAEGAVINDAALKAITSGEFMTAERKFRDPFSFQPYATCWFGTNHMPHTRDFSDALFRRASILTFNNKFDTEGTGVGAPADPHLKEALLKELPGILNLALHGIGCVQVRGSFTAPESSKDALKEWRVEADQVRQFTNSACHMQGEITKAALYEKYRDWCREQHIQTPLKQRTFSNRLAMRGVTDRKSGAFRYYVGISLN